MIKQLSKVGGALFLVLALQGWDMPGMGGGTEEKEFSYEALKATFLRDEKPQPFLAASQHYKTFTNPSPQLKQAVEQVVVANPKPFYEQLDLLKGSPLKYTQNKDFPEINEVLLGAALVDADLQLARRMTAKANAFLEGNPGAPGVSLQTPADYQQALGRIGQLQTEGKVMLAERRERAARAVVALTMAAELLDQGSRTAQKLQPDAQRMLTHFSSPSFQEQVKADPAKALKLPGALGSLQGAADTLAKAPAQAQQLVQVCAAVSGALTRMVLVK